MLLLFVACSEGSLSSYPAEHPAKPMNVSTLMDLADTLDAKHLVVIMSLGRSGSTLICNLVSFQAILFADQMLVLSH
jgi:hypothetical protein